jgi:predicted metal-dependent hydrolase
MSDMPAYRIRQSRRARAVQLSLCPIRGLEVVVPEGFDPARVPSVVRRHRDWLERAWARLRRWKNEFPEGHDAQLPSRLELQALGESWSVRYEHAGSLAMRAEGDALIVRGPAGAEGALRDRLRRWLKARARECFVPWLNAVGERTGLRYQRASIRGQRSRWASCSSRGTISLNYKMLFLPAHLVDYLMVHELSHTRHLDHSRRFWSLVERHCPDYRSCERELGTAWRYVPLWNEMD